MTRAPRIALCHVPVSHFSEKVRWALDYKRIPHTRRWPPGGLHPVATFILTRGKHQTVPVLVMDGEAIGDSTEIIRRLEERFPDPALYPADSAGRERALELEEVFDEGLGPAIRRLAYHHFVSDPRVLTELTLHHVQYARPATVGIMKVIMTRFLDLRFSTASPEKAREAEREVVAALDRLELELDGRPYLVGESFTVADLAAAALLYPIVLPPETPWLPSRFPPAWEEFLSAQRERPACQWAAEIYRRHRSAPDGVARERRLAAASPGT